MAAVEGPIPETAVRVPLTPEKIRDQLSRTGGTPFVCRQVMAQVEEGLSLPLSALNSLRRQVLEELGKARLAPVSRQTGEFRPGVRYENTRHPPAVTVSVRLARQVSPELLKRKPALLYLPAGEGAAHPEAVQLAQKYGVEVAALLPRVCWDSERKILDEAYAGDIIGVFDPGIFSIGDTLCMPKEKFAYEGIPTFAPEHFARVRQVDTMKRKQFTKGVQQIAQEGAIQIFQEFNSGMEEIIVGVVGVLQFDVLKYRLENEYNVEIRMENLPYEHIRWIANKDQVDVEKLTGTSDMKKVKDMKGNPLLLFVNSWSIGMTLDRNKGLELSEFSRE